MPIAIVIGKQSKALWPLAPLGMSISREFVNNPYRESILYNAEKHKVACLCLKCWESELSLSSFLLAVTTFT